MKEYMSASIAFLIACSGIWFFADALWWMDDQRKLLESQIRNETVLRIGVKEPCIADVRVSTWESMNTLGVYKWVSTCEDAQ